MVRQIRICPVFATEGDALDRPWPSAPPAWAKLFQAVIAGGTATADSILGRGDVDVNLAVSGVAPLLLAAVHNYSAPNKSQDFGFSVYIVPNRKSKTIFEC